MQYQLILTDDQLEALDVVLELVTIHCFNNIDMDHKYYVQLLTEINKLQHIEDTEVI